MGIIWVQIGPNLRNRGQREGVGQFWTMSIIFQVFFGSRSFFQVLQNKTISSTIKWFIISHINNYITIEKNITETFINSKPLKLCNNIFF